MATRFSPAATKRADDIFFTTLSIFMLLIVLVGFAPSYFLRGAVFAPLPSVLVHLHGAVFSAWIILLPVQSLLVSAGNLRLHRKLGVLGAVIAGLMVVFGVLAPFGTLRRGAHLPSFFTPASFLIDNILGILIFGAFIAVAIWKRNNRTAHKRLIIIATVILMPPPLSRIPFVQQHFFIIPAITLGILVAMIVFDIVTRRRPSLATVIGGLIFVLSNPLMTMADHTAAAQRLTLWAQHHP